MESMKTPEPWNIILVKELKKLNEVANNGRGVSVVRSVITWLAIDEIESARREASTDHDKIRNYPEIYELLKAKLFDGVELYSWIPDEKS